MKEYYSTLEEARADLMALWNISDPKLREGVGMLLAEIMRIKAEGDYAAGKELVEKYGVRFDPALRDEVVARYRKLNLPTYWAGINPDLVPTHGAGGRVTNVSISYPRDFIRQRLSWSAMYEPTLRAALARAQRRRAAGRR